MATKKFAELIGTKNTEAATWEKIRVALRDDIAAAFKLSVEYDGSVQLGRMLGLNETLRRLAMEEAVAGPFTLNPDWFLIRLRRLTEIAAVPVQAYDFFRIFLNNYSHEWAKSCAKILAAALPIAQAELTAAISTEENFFADVGLPRQETPLAQGVARVIEKLKASAEHFDRLLKIPKREQFPQPEISFLPEIFADEIAKHAATVAAIASEKESQA